MIPAGTTSAVRDGGRKHLQATKHKAMCCEHCWDFLELNEDTARLCLLPAFDECLNGFVEVLLSIEDKVRTLLVNEVAPWFVGLSKVFQPIGNHSGHACFLNLSVGPGNKVGLFDTRLEFEANTHSV